MPRLMHGKLTTLLAWAFARSDCHDCSMHSRQFPGYKEAPAAGMASCAGRCLAVNAMVDRSNDQP